MAELGSRQLSLRESSIIQEQNFSKAGGSDPEMKRSSQSHRLGTSEGSLTRLTADQNDDAKDIIGGNGYPQNGFEKPNKGEEDNINTANYDEHVLGVAETNETHAMSPTLNNNTVVAPVPGDRESLVLKTTDISNISIHKNKSRDSVASAFEPTPVPHNGSSQSFLSSQMRTYRDSNRRTLASSLYTGPLKPNQSRMSVLSKTSSYYHGDIVDENLLLSAARIDSTLLRLFSRSRNGERTKKVLESEDRLLPFLNYSDSDLISMDAVLWRVHPMGSVHKETLEQEMNYLEENVKPLEILQRLYMDEVLTHMDYNTITRTEGQGERAVTRLLMKTLMRRGDKAFPGLISSLQTLHYGHVAERLQDTALKLRMTMEDEIRDSQFRSTFVKKHLDSPQFGDAHAPVGHTQRPTTAPKPDETKLQEHLNSLDQELKALHDDVTALKTARTQSIATDRNSSPNQPSQSQNAENRVPPKSSSCSIL